LSRHVFPPRKEDGSLYLFFIDDLIDNTLLSEAIEKVKQMPPIATRVLKAIMFLCATMLYSVVFFCIFELLYHPQYLSLIATHEYYTYGLAIPMAFISGSLCLRIAFRMTR
jgi:hypothetical protein